MHSEEEALFLEMIDIGFVWSFSSRSSIIRLVLYLEKELRKKGEKKGKRRERRKTKIKPTSHLRGHKNPEIIPWLFNSKIDQFIFTKPISFSFIRGFIFFGI